MHSLDFAADRETTLEAVQKPEEERLSNKYRQPHPHPHNWDQQSNNSNTTNNAASDTSHQGDYRTLSDEGVVATVDT